jgi:hypothetical protein
MITYNLAKELSDAGLQLPGRRFAIDLFQGQPVPLPSLTDLISACGEEFGCLVRLSDGRWRAICRTSSTEAEGAIPDEAVARQASVKGEA